jgi:hypothetical protein
LIPMRVFNSAMSFIASLARPPVQRMTGRSM